MKPKQYVSCLLVLWCFLPWFCKFSCLVCSVKCVCMSGSNFPRAEREAPPAILQRYYHKIVIDTELYSSNVGQFIRR